MPKDRTITGFGPTASTQLSGSTSPPITGTWFSFGPIRGTNVGVTAVFSAASSGAGQVKLRGALSTNSTGAFVTVATRLSSQSGTNVLGGSSFIFTRWQFFSTSLSTGVTVTGYLAGLA